jgi:hypothetical protein
MTTDLDTKVRAAVHAAASTVDVSDDALASILERAARRTARRRRRLLVGLVAVGGLVGSGTAYAFITDRLTPEQAEVISRLPSCGLDGETARLVASTLAGGRTIEFWTVDTATSHGDFVFVEGEAGGGGSCGPVSRADAYPTLPWVNYQLAENGDGTGEFWFLGQAPQGTAEVAILTDAGTVRAQVSSPEGYFLVAATLPLPQGDRVQGIQAFGPDGSLLGTGGLS